MIVIVFLLLPETANMGHFIRCLFWLLKTCLILPQRSVVNVEWKETHVRNLYRVGHKGKVHTWLYVRIPPSNC